MVKEADLRILLNEQFDALTLKVDSLALELNEAKAQVFLRLGGNSFDLRLDMVQGQTMQISHDLCGLMFYISMVRIRMHGFLG